MNKLAVFFPGVHYGVDCPLLYYARLVYEQAGYSILNIKYYSEKDNNKLGKFAKMCLQDVKKQLKQDIISSYDEVIFVSKSIGSVIAVALEDDYDLNNVVHVMLTPINLTLDYMNKKRNYKCIVTGLSDKTVEHEKLKEICKNNNLPLTQIPDVAHRLEVKGDAVKSIEILKTVVNLY